MDPDWAERFLDLRYLNDSYGWVRDESGMYNVSLFPERGEGMYVWMEGDSLPYLDLILGYSSVNFGHCHPVMQSAVRSALNGIEQIHAFHSRPQLCLSKLLVEQLQASDQYRVYLDVGGSNIVAAALRLCQAHTKRRQIVALDGAFHGVGHICAAVTDRRLLNADQYGPRQLSSHDVVNLPFADAIKGPTVSASLEALDATLSQNTTAAVIVEPVQGAGGFNIPAQDFLVGVQRLANHHQVPLIFDEIQSGLGRCGRFFAYQRWTRTPPDIILVGKSLAAGYYPLSALIAKAELLSHLPEAGSAFQSTFNNNPFGSAIALQAVLFGLREGLFSCADSKGEMFLPLMQQACHSPLISNVRGVGLAIAFDITTNSEPSPRLARQLVDIAIAQRVLLYCSGTARHVIKIAPPLTSTESDFRLITERVATIVETLERGANAPG